MVASRVNWKSRAYFWVTLHYWRHTTGPENWQKWRKEWRFGCIPHDVMKTVVVQRWYMVVDAKNQGKSRLVGKPEWKQADGRTGPIAVRCPLMKPRWRRLDDEEVTSPSAAGSASTADGWSSRLQQQCSSIEQTQQQATRHTSHNESAASCRAVACATPSLICCIHIIFLSTLCVINNLRLNWHGSICIARFGCCTVVMSTTWIIITAICLFD